MIYDLMKKIKNKIKRSLADLIIEDDKIVYMNGPATHFLLLSDKDFVNTSYDENDAKKIRALLNT